MIRIGIVLAALLMSSAAHAGERLEAYRDVQRALTGMNVTAETVEQARIAFPSQPDIIGLLSGLVRDKETQGRNPLALTGPYSEAYFAFIKAPADSDILFEFLEDQSVLVERGLDGTESHPGSTIAWGWANLAQAAVYGFEATGERRFVDFYLDGARRVFDQSDQARGIEDSFGNENLPGWSMVTRDQPGREVTLPGRIIGPMVEMAIVSAEDTASLDDDTRSEIRELADRGIEVLRSYLPLSETEDGISFFRFPWTREHEAVNHMAAFARASALAYALSGDQDLKSAAENFRSYFLAHVETGPTGAYSWPYQVLAEGQHDEQFWKGAITVPALIDMHKRGVEIAQADRVGVIKSFSDYVIGKFFKINAYMSEFDFPISGYNSRRLGYSNGLLFQQFIMLDEWDPSIRKTVLEAIASRQDLFPTGFFLHSSDAVPYAHMLLYPDRG